MCRKNSVGEFLRKLFPMLAHLVPMPLVTLFSWFGLDFMNRLSAAVTTPYPNSGFRASVLFRQLRPEKFGPFIAIEKGLYSEKVPPVLCLDPQRQQVGGAPPVFSGA